MLQWFPQRQHKKGANINPAHWGLKKESIDLIDRFVASGCKDHHQPCPCTHSSRNSAVCLINPLPPGLVHPADGNTTSLFQHPLAKEWWNGRNESVSLQSPEPGDVAVEAQSHCSCHSFGNSGCQRTGGFAAQQEGKEKK